MIDFSSIISSDRGLSEDTLRSITVSALHVYSDNIFKQIVAFESLGSTGWNWSSFLEYFKKVPVQYLPVKPDSHRYQSETFSVSEAEEKSFNVKFDPSTDGTSGPLHRTMSKWIGHVHVPFQKTMESLGLPFNTNSVSMIARDNCTYLWFPLIRTEEITWESGTPTTVYTRNMPLAVPQPQYVHPVGVWVNLFD